jgi:hypothetical protein
MGFAAYTKQEHGMSSSSLRFNFYIIYYSSLKAIFIVILLDFMNVLSYMALTICPDFSGRIGYSFCSRNSRESFIIPRRDWINELQ